MCVNVQVWSVYPCSCACVHVSTFMCVCVLMRVTCVCVCVCLVATDSHAVAGKVTYGNSRTFLELGDPGRAHPVTGARERRPPPAPRSMQSVRDTSAEYARLLPDHPTEADVHYAANGQGTPSPLFGLPYDWTAVPDGMHVVHPSSLCRAVTQHLDTQVCIIAPTRRSRTSSSALSN